MFKNLFTRGFNFSHYNWTKTRNAFKIDLSVFQGSFLQVLNKLTWNAVVTFPGRMIAHAFNIAGKMDKVTQLDGMVAMAGITNVSDKAFTIGHYSFGPDNYKADWRDHLFVHEYGHYMQSQIVGPLYYPAIAIPSLLSAAFTSDWEGMSHKQRWFEIDASRRAAKHFDKKYGSKLENYDSESPDFFDVNIFNTGGKSKYVNPRTGSTKQIAHPTHGSRIVFWDFVL